MYEELVVYEGNYFLVKQCLDVSIPGYLIIVPKSKVFYLSDLSPELLHLLIGLMAKIERILREVLKVEMIYIAKFAELKKGLHFHIFPRTDKILQEYIRENPSSTDRISGPLIFDWSRNKFKSDIERIMSDKTIIDTILTIKQKLEST